MFDIWATDNSVQQTHQAATTVLPICYAAKGLSLLRRQPVSQDCLQDAYKNGLDGGATGNAI
jgi:hypothetical protein